MLVLSRKEHEDVVIGDATRVTVVAIQGNTVRLGITAPEEVPIYRRELAERAQRVLGQEPSSAGAAGLGEAPGWPGDGVVEVPLLLPARQAAALEARARARGLTLGQLIRRLCD